MGQEKSERERKYPTLFLLSNEREENPTISTCIATLIRELPLVQVLGYIQYICLDCTYTAVTFAAFFFARITLYSEKFSPIRARRHQVNSNYLGPRTVVIYLFTNGIDDNGVEVVE